VLNMQDKLAPHKPILLDGSGVESVLAQIQGYEAKCPLVWALEDVHNMFKSCIPQTACPDHLFLCHGFTAAMPEHRGASRCVAYKSVNSLHHFTRFTVWSWRKSMWGDTWE
jgi:hypothetical protein